MLAAVMAVGTMTAATASSLPAVNGNYEGNYGITDAFSTHGLWLPNFIGNQYWSVQSGTANYAGSDLTMTGTATKSIGSQTYSLDFSFAVVETSDAPNGLVCGGNTGAGSCQSQQGGAGEANIVHFDMGTNSIMGTLTGSAGNILEGLSMDIEMVPLGGPGRKPGQLGYGGNWVTDDFGYSNWMEWDVTADSIASVSYGTSGTGDVNFTFLPTPVPVPAGFPLMLAGLGAFYWLRRRAA